MKELVTQGVLYKYSIRNIPFAVEHPAPPPEGLPDGSAFAHIIFLAEHYFTYLFFVIGILHHIHRFPVPFHQVTKVVLKVLKCARPMRVGCRNQLCTRSHDLPERNQPVLPLPKLVASS